MLLRLIFMALLPAKFIILRAKTWNIISLKQAVKSFWSYNGAKIGRFSINICQAAKILEGR